MKRVELLAPAGDLARLKTAIIYGADAVYFGGRQFSLRSRASNFSNEDISEAVQFAHSHGRRVFVTVNMIPHNSDFQGLREYLQLLQEYGVDAIICASGAILELAKKHAPKLEVHISTQQTTTNTAAISYWKRLNADRIVLGREVSLDQLNLIIGKTDMPLEVFIHGGMCANYSGRCIISNFLTNRDANRGGCAQSCRWNYHLYKDDQCLDNGEYLFSLGSKDMCAVDYIEDLLKSGVVSLKIEGRMKTAYYIASVVKAYRMLIDDYYENGTITPEVRQKAMRLLDLVSNRDTYEGFYGNEISTRGQIYNFVLTASQTFLANVVSYDRNDSTAIIEVRNNFSVKDRVCVFNPQGDDVEFVLDELKTPEGEDVITANRPMQLLKIKVPCEVNEYTFIRGVEE